MFNAGMAGAGVAGDVSGRFGAFGGRFVPETLVSALDELAEVYAAAAADATFRAEVEALGRPTLELPLLPGPMDVGCLFELAARLEDHLSPAVTG